MLISSKMKARLTVLEAEDKGRPNRFRDEMEQINQIHRVGPSKMSLPEGSILAFRWRRAIQAALTAVTRTIALLRLLLNSLDS